METFNLGLCPKVAYCLLSSHWYLYLFSSTTASHQETSLIMAEQQLTYEYSSVLLGVILLRSFSSRSLAFLISVSWPLSGMGSVSRRGPSI